MNKSGVLKDTNQVSAQTPKLSAIDSDPAIRACPPEDVWNFSQFKSWKESVWNLIEDFATSEVIENFLKNPPRYVVGDNLSWLDNIVNRTCGEVIDSKYLLADRLREHYNYIRASHGTRTSEVELFYRHGLKPLNAENYHDLAKKLFLGGDFPELNDDSLESAIQSVRSDLRQGRVFFETNEIELLSHCGHYLIYGSEYLVSLAANLGGARDYRQILTKQGKPTMFICDVPLDLVDDETLAEFAGEALEILFQELLDGQDYEEDTYRVAGFCIYSPLPASCIVGHYHPESVPDPFLGFVHR